MNKYPIWWDTTVTIYNQYTDPLTNVTTWNRVVVSNCYWHNRTNRVVVGDTTLEANSIICRIPKDSRYRSRLDYVQTPNDIMMECFTLGKDDIIIKGEVEDIIDEYTKGHRSTDLLNKYKGLSECMQIEEFADNTGPGRVNEHYLVRGK